VISLVPNFFDGIKLNVLSKLARFFKKQIVPKYFDPDSFADPKQLDLHLAAKVIAPI